MSAVTSVGTIRQPVDVIAERLNDPAVAASLVTLLDNAELLSTLVLGLSEFLERGDTIMDNVAAGLNELKGADFTGGAKVKLPTLTQLGAISDALTKGTPLLTQALDSSLATPATLVLLAMINDAAAEGVAQARTKKTTIHGVRALLHALKDPEVGRGLGVVIEIAKALGRRVS